MKIKYVFTLSNKTKKIINIEIDRERFLESKEIFNITTNKFASTILYSTDEINNAKVKEFEALISSLDEFFPVQVYNAETDEIIAEFERTAMTITVTMENNGAMVKRVSLIAYDREEDYGINN